ncbi:MAG: hypothetical protein HY791_16625 [Deltaproteobacteria bacterium]|nr:hypothetical protein [Deltaproteobacteria bacterium]
MLTLLFGVLAQLSGTAPGELGLPPQPSSACNCHIGYDPDRYVEPWDTYASTPMALAAVDPLFRAALQVAHQDRPELSPVCLRCHAPIGWLSQRGTPGDGSQLSRSSGDFEGITCDVCHRAVPTDPPLVGDAQYTIAQEATKRARRGNGPGNGHSVAASDYVGSSNLCGVCHSLFNPLEQHHSTAHEPFGIPYFEQRTFEEWQASAFPARGTGCVECHLERAEGRAASIAQNTYSDLSLHTIVGGNSWVVRAVQAVEPQFPVGDADAFVLKARASLRGAARLEFLTEVAEGPAGGIARVKARFTNLTGHKLPTGYPEGRKIVLELSLTLGGQTEILSGAFDATTGDFHTDDQIRVYDTGHGCSGKGTKCAETGRNRHLALVDETLWDTRVPPEGYRPNHPDMIPMGRDYGSAPFRHYDDVEYAVPIPAGTPAGTAGTIKLRALYQVVDGAYVRFLLDTLGRTQADAVRLNTAFERTSRGAPTEMTFAELGLRVTEPVDAGFADSGASDATPSVQQPAPSCACDGARGTSYELLAFAAPAALLFVRRRRTREHEL